MRRQVLFAGIAATVLAGLGFVVVNSLTDTDSDPDAHTDTSTEPSTEPSTDASEATAAKLRVRPPIAQPGPTAAPADDADIAMTAELKPVDVGGEVTLERLDGSTWVEVATRPVNARGAADFTAPAKVKGEVATYRASAGAGGGEDDVTSPEVRADRWGKPDFSDEFSGTALKATWDQRGQEHNAAAKRACSTGSPDAVEVRDGTVRLSVLEDPAKAGTKCEALDGEGKSLGEYDWRLNGHISTEHTLSFRYGFAAARIKYQPLRGQHGAFWMKPADPHRVFNDPDHINDPKRSGAEIDVTEWFGNDHPSGGLTNYAYYPGLKGETVKVGSWLKHPSRFLSGADDSWSSQFHVFSVEWTPHSYVFRIDGQETFRTQKGVSGQPEFLILSLLSSDFELQYLKDGGLPQTMQVDWVRYWERP
jgi:beta-glucanase (GH16 family)